MLRSAFAGVERVRDDVAAPQGGASPPRTRVPGLNVDVAPNDEFGAVSLTAYLPAEKLLSLMLEPADPD